MKYKEYPIEKARQECKKHAYKKIEKHVLCHCEECPLRRTRKDEKGKEWTLFCYWQLQDLVSELAEEWNEMSEEDIKYLGESEN